MRSSFLWPHVDQTLPDIGDALGVRIPFCPGVFEVPEAWVPR